MVVTLDACGLNEGSREDLAASIEKARDNYEVFIRSNRIGLNAFKLAKNTDTTPFARCFAVFGLKLIQSDLFAELKLSGIADEIIEDLNAFSLRRKHHCSDLTRDKPYMQLLCFSLSALHLLDAANDDRLLDHIRPILSLDVVDNLDSHNTKEGKAGSGNFAMFLAVTNIYAHQFCGINRKTQIDEWLYYHLSNINDFGFWGKAKAMTYLQFQNGYHQYEILEYLDVENQRQQVAIDNVMRLMDSEGHFGVYPGGGACYDYDAVFIALGPCAGAKETVLMPLLKTLTTLLHEQNADGGFADSHHIRPLNYTNLKRLVSHSVTGSPAAVWEKSYQLAHLLRPINNVLNRFSGSPVLWSDSCLWASWFRMLVIARIGIALDIVPPSRWTFIDFPGIGFVPKSPDLRLGDPEVLGRIPGK